MATEEEMRRVLMAQAIDAARADGEPPDMDAVKAGIDYTIEGIQQGAYPATLARIEEILAEEKAERKRMH